MKPREIALLIIGAVLVVGFVPAVIFAYRSGSGVLVLTSFLGAFVGGALLVLVIGHRNRKAIQEQRAYEQASGSVAAVSQSVLLRLFPPVSLAIAGVVLGIHAAQNPESGALYWPLAAASVAGAVLLGAALYRVFKRDDGES